MTQAILRSLFVALLALAGGLAASDARAECCGAVLYCSPSTSGNPIAPNPPVPYCADCTPGPLIHLFGNCANGSCNIFGCNCDGGCRTGNGHCSTQAGASNVCVGGGAGAEIAAVSSPPTEETLEQTWDQFKTHDSNDDDVIDATEFLDSLRANGVALERDTPQERMVDLLLAEFHKLDVNRTGTIEPAEFDASLDGYER